MPPQIDTSQQFFVQSKTGQEVLIRMKHFMKQHILPAEKVSTIQTNRMYLCSRTVDE